MLKFESYFDLQIVDENNMHEFPAMLEEDN